MKSKGDIKKCVHCNKDVNTSSDKFVTLRTFTGKVIIEDAYFHFKCWKDFYNGKVLEKSKNIVNNIRTMTQNLISEPNISELLNKVGGIDTLKNMLNTDLGKIDKEVDKSKSIAKKIMRKNDNGKTKRKTIKKNKM